MANLKFSTKCEILKIPVYESETIDTRRGVANLITSRNWYEFEYSGDIDDVTFVDETLKTYKNPEYILSYKFKPFYIKEVVNDNDGSIDTSGSIYVKSKGAIAKSDNGIIVIVDEDEFSEIVYPSFTNPDIVFQQGIPYGGSISGSDLNNYYFSTPISMGGYWAVADFSDFANYTEGSEEKYSFTVTSVTGNSLSTSSVYNCGFPNTRLLSLRLNAGYNIYNNGRCVRTSIPTYGMIVVCDAIKR